MAPGSALSTRQASIPYYFTQINQAPNHSIYLIKPYNYHLDKPATGLIIRFNETVAPKSKKAPAHVRKKAH
jgi:hypothetical protein